MSDGEISLRARSLDYAGKTANTDVQLVLDTIDTVVEYFLPVSGTAGDTKEVNQVFLTFTTMGSKPPLAVSEAAGWTLLSQLYSWNAQIDIRLLADAQNHTIHSPVDSV